MNKQIFILTFAFTLISGQAIATDYYCKANKKVNFEFDYPPEELLKWNFATKVIERNNGVYLSRCSFILSEKKTTCDDYKVDKIVFDSFSKIKKYYVFDRQFDFQIFHNLQSLENNGRGDIGFGKCKIIRLN